MLFKEIQEIKSNTKELKEFGIVLGIAFALLASLLFKKGLDYSWLAAISAFFFFFGLVLPRFLKPIHKIWMGISLILGWIMTRVILALLFFLVVTPTGLLARLFGKEFLELKFRKGDAKSFWVAREKKEFRPQDYENQY
jgi:hypothetical protein